MPHALRSDSGEQPLSLFALRTCLIVQLCTLSCRGIRKALASVHEDHGCPAVVPEIIAIHILNLAATGDRDVNVLCQEASIEWGTRRKVPLAIPPDGPEEAR
jgi:hypothetical protein